MKKKRGAEVAFGVADETIGEEGGGWMGLNLLLPMTSVIGARA